VTDYPGAIPTFATLTPGPSGTLMSEPGKSGTDVVAKIHDELRAALLALGVNPQGGAADLAARLAALDSTVGGKESAGAATSAVSAHVGAADPHGDRAYALAQAAAAQAASQPLDSDLTAIAALSTTSFGRGLLALADAAAGRTALGLGSAATTAATAYDAAGAAASAQAASQPVDSDLTAIAALTTTSYGRALLTLADAAALTALGNTVTSSLKGLAPASGGGTANFLRADGTWAAPAGGSSGYDTVKDEGSSLTQRATVDFLGPGVAAVDNSGGSKTDVSVMGFWDQPAATNHVVFPAHIYSMSTDYGTQNECRAGRLWLKAGTVFKGISMRARSAGSGCTFRAAVYTDSGGGAPSALVSGTEVSHSIAGTGIVTDLFASTWTVPSDGFYWIAAALDGSGSAPALHSWLLAPPVGTATAQTFPVRNGTAYTDLSYSGGGALNSSFSGAAASTNAPLMPMALLVRN
jgi:hypothetical protein